MLLIWVTVYSNSFSILGLEPFLFFVIAVPFIDADPLIALQTHPLLSKIIEIVEWHRPTLCAVAHTALPISCCLIVVIFISKSVAFLCPLSPIFLCSLFFLLAILDTRK